MYEHVRWYCKTCKQCQMRSSYRTKIPIEPTYVRTIVRKFGIDSVHMPKGKGGYAYIVDIRDDLSGWVEAQMFGKITSKNVAKFMFSVMCRFGCIPQLVSDNGSEFEGAMTVLMDTYNVPMIKISPYNPKANGMNERGHGTWVGSIWKTLEGQTDEWPLYFDAALYADRTTVKRTTGYMPYYLLYGQNPLSRLLESRSCLGPLEPRKVLRSSTITTDLGLSLGINITTNRFLRLDDFSSWPARRSSFACRFLLPDFASWFYASTRDTR